MTMHTEGEVLAAYEEIKKLRIAGVEPGYDKGWIDGVYIALQWVLSEDVASVWRQ